MQAGSKALLGQRRILPYYASDFCAVFLEKRPTVEEAYTRARR